MHPVVHPSGLLVVRQESLAASSGIHARFFRDSATPLGNALRLTLRDPPDRVFHVKDVELDDFVGVVVDDNLAVDLFHLLFEHVQLHHVTECH